MAVVYRKIQDKFKPMSDLCSQLKLIGLNVSEITVYLFLLENGLSTPPIVSRGTKIARTNCYNLLESLKGKGLIDEQVSGNRKAYLASDPESLVRSLEKKKEAIQQILPDLRGLYTTQKNKPKIQFYEGAEQIREIYIRSLEAPKIMAIGSTNQLEVVLPGLLKYYFDEIKRREIIFRDILTTGSQKIGLQTKEALKGFYDLKFLPSEYKDPPTDILIWNNNVALLTLKEPIFGTVLTSHLLSQTFSMLFDLIWTRQ